MLGLIFKQRCDKIASSPSLDGQEIGLTSAQHLFQAISSGFKDFEQPTQVTWTFMQAGLPVWSSLKAGL